jgi:hypothetical protein
MCSSLFGLAFVMLASMSSIYSRSSGGTAVSAIQLDGGSDKPCKRERFDVGVLCILEWGYWGLGGCLVVRSALVPVVG